MMWTLDKTNFEFYLDRFYIFPAVILDVNNMLYACPTFAIEFHWLGLHTRVLWVKEGYHR
jgi:hypothetical protein